MKKLLIIGLIAISPYCFSQNGNTPQNKKTDYYSAYQIALSNENPNYFEIYDAFDTYWKSLDENMKAENARSLKLFKRWNWFWGPRMQGSDGNMTKFSAEYKKAIEEGEDKIESRIKIYRPCPSWKAIGPDSIYGVGPNNNPSFNSRGVGRVTSLDFHRQFNGNYGYGVTPNSFEPSANTIFACSNTGGIFKSKNGGKNWLNLRTDRLLYTGVRDFEISDYNDNEYYFISTYGGNSLANGAHGTTAIYRTDNGGLSWKMGGAPFNTVNSGYNPYNNNIVNDIEIIPSGTSSFNEYILVASKSGVHRSSNKAVSFNPSFMPSFRANFSEGPTKITSSPSTTRLYLNGGISWGDGMSKGYDSDTIYRSTNRGLSWSAWKTIDINGCNANTLSLGIPSSVDANTYIANHAVYVSPSNGNKIWVVVQAITNAPSSFTVSCGGGITIPSGGWKTLSYLFLSTNGGSTWTKKITAERRNQPSYWVGSSNIINPHGIVVNPLDDTKLYQYVSLGGTEGLLHSDDDGATWDEVKPKNYHYDSRVLKLKPISTSSGVKVFGLAGHDGGLNLNDDITNDFDDINAWDNITGRGLQVSQIYRHSSSKTSKKGRLIVFGGQDIGHSVRTGFKTNSWEHQGWATGDGMGCAFDFSDSTRFYIADGQSGGSLKRGTKVGSAFTSYNSINPSAGEGTYWVAPLLLNPQNNKVVVVGYKNIYKSKGLITSGGTSKFNKLNNSTLTGNKLITKIAFAPSDSNIIFGTLIKTDNSAGNHRRVFKSTNGGASWSWSGTWWFSFVSDIAIHPTNSNIVIATYSGVQSWSTTNSKVKISYDQGVSWQDWGTGLVDIPVNAIVFDALGQKAYVGTDRGIFVRNMSATKWTRYGCGLPNTIVSDLDLSEEAGKLRASTYGRGMWEVCIKNCPTSLPHEPLPHEIGKTKGLLPPVNNSDNNPNVKSDKMMKVAPNPNNGQFKVLFKANTLGKGKIIIKSMNGSILYSSDFNHEKGVQNTFKIDLTNQTSGVYLVTIRTENKSETIRVVKN